MIVIPNIFTKYFDLEQAIHDYFGYKEDWVKIPLADFREDEWLLVQEENGSGWITHGPKINFETLDAGNDIYSATIYTQRFLPQWVWRGPDYTLVAMDTHTDGNKYLGIFMNSKEVKDKKEFHKAQYYGSAF